MPTGSSCEDANSSEENLRIGHPHPRRKEVRVFFLCRPWVPERSFQIVRPNDIVRAQQICAQQQNHRGKIG